MESNGKKTVDEQQGKSQNAESSEKLKRQENEGQQGNDYTEDQGEDENGEKPSADEQE